MQMIRQGAFDESHSPFKEENFIGIFAKK